jgi:dolichol-phosphate mannosyltransferase
MDCDLQDRPEEITRLYHKAQEGHEVVLARRVDRQDAFLKKITSRLFYKVFQGLSGLPYDGEVGNFRIFSRKVADRFREMRESLRFFGGLMQWIGFPAARVDVRHAERYAGKTTYTYRKLFALGFETVIAYSDKPLRVAVQLGFLMAFAAFVAGGYIFYQAIVHSISVTGWGSLMVSLYFIGGLIIAILGIIGIYLGKTFNETKKRPLYVVRTFRNIKP